MPKVWGGRRLDDFVPGGLEIEGPVGEVWNVADRDDSSSVVAGGTFDGRSLSGLMLSERDDLLGDASASAADRFPLMVKYLDADQPLSVQVHPDAICAEKLGGEPKDECWYVIAAGEDAHVYLGLAEGVDASAFASGASDHHVVDLLQRHDVRAGQFLSVPAGTVHAIGPGVTLVEVQENADTTWRVYDWDRPGLNGQPRELHLDQALRAINYDDRPVGPVTPSYEGSVNGRAPLFTGPTFLVEALRVNEPMALETGRKPSVCVVLSGKAELEYEGGTVNIRRGESWLIPAALGAHRLQAADGDLELLRMEAS